MEIKGSSKFWVCLYEAVGTAMLLISINWGASGGYQPVCIAITVLAAIINLGPICGAHFNGAVTIAVFIQEITNWRENILYCLVILLSQIVGASFGLFIVWLSLFKGTDGSWQGGLAKLCPPLIDLDSIVSDPSQIVQCGPNGTTGRVFLVEVVCTFLFVSLIMSIKYNNGSFDIANAICVSFSLLGMIFASGSISGGCLNPIVGLTQTLFQHFMDDKLTLSSLWIYILAPTTAGILSGLWSHFNVYSLKKKNE